MEHSTQQLEPRRRRRPALSCIECRRKKVSCDRTNPCRRCVSAGSQCNYRVHKSVPALQHHVERSEVPDEAHSSSLPVDQISTKPTEAIHSKFDLTLGTVESNETPSINRLHAVEQHLREFDKRLRNLEDFSSNPQCDYGDITADQSELPSLQKSLNRVKPYRQTHWFATPQEFAQIISFFKEAAVFKQIVEPSDGKSFQDPVSRQCVAETVDLLQKCKSLARKMKVGRPTRLLSHPWLNFAPPSQNIATPMASSYFKYFESTYRILHVPSFWHNYDRYWDDPEAAPVALRLEVCLVVAIGSSVIDQKDQEVEYRQKVHEWIYAAQTWLSGPLEKNRLGMKAIQIHCLAILARQIFGIGGDLVWTSMGSLIQEAMQLGLHRDPRHLPSINLFQSELRRRLWATILEMVVQSSLDSEMPARISLDEFDTEPPANTNDDEMDESITELHLHPRNEYTATSVQLCLLDSLRTRLRIVEALNGLKSEVSYAEVLALSASIAKACGLWCILDTQNNDRSVTPFHRNFADFFVRRFLLHLHAPFSCKAGTNHIFHYSRKVSLDAALAIITPEDDESLSRLMVVSGGIFKSEIRYAGVIIGIELIAQTQAQSSDLTLLRNAEYRTLLKQAIRKLLSLSVDRIQHGESNVKNHTFLKTILAEVESLEAGSSSELEIATSARDSLQFCYDLLVAQAGSEFISGYKDVDFTYLDGEIADFALDFDVENFLQDTIFS